MENRSFRLPDHGVEARLRRLDQAQAEALELALQGWGDSGGPALADAGALPLFLLPLAECGLSARQILSLLEKLPAGFPLDHRQIYFDFRLARWLKHIEPPTFAEIMEEYLVHAETREAGLAYLRREWEVFLRRQPEP
jgi:hypothetical protein